MDADSGSKRNFSQLNQNAPELGYQLNQFLCAKGKYYDYFLATRK